MVFYIVLVCVLFAIISVVVSFEGQPKIEPRKKKRKR